MTKIMVCFIELQLPYLVDITIVLTKVFSSRNIENKNLDKQ
jgi:hypothetical protein